MRRARLPIRNRSSELHEVRSRMMWKFLLPFAAFIALVVLFAFGLNPKRDIHALPSPLIGKPAPSIALTDVMDPTRPVNNSAFNGQVYIVNVWGTLREAARRDHEPLLEMPDQRVFT